MHFRRLGASGLSVSPLCLGTMRFGDRTHAPEAARIVARAGEAGVNFIDTADVYATGESERMVGRLIRADRAWWVVATKVGNAMASARRDPNRRGLGRGWMLRAVNDSLRRLGSDVIDLSYLHRDDEATPLEETLAAMADIIRAGKVRYWGVSNFRGWRLAEAIRVAERAGMPRPIAAQPYYNAVNRMPEVEVLPACRHYGLGVVPYSPLARGVLTGKYPVDREPPAETRAGRQDRRMMQTEFRRESLVIAGRLRAHAESRGSTPGRLALNWVLNAGEVSSVIAGPRTLDQWNDYLAALDDRFDAADEALIDGLVAAGHPSTPGYSDPLYPVTGRTPRTAAAGR